ncbi:MAG TPA: hypothetical protein VKP67_12390 [Xanthobacteraceae bacterium]|nr:hypothetical protein [Xanthobacteraceae bacterium]
MRASGFSLAFGLGAALFGTFTPLVSTFLIDAGSIRAAPGFWLMFAAHCSLMATAAFYRTGQRATIPLAAAAPAPAAV